MWTGDISPQNRHLLILDGYNSHITLDVVREASAAGLDLLTLSAHTSHTLQPLDKSVFKPFKQHFREYRDFWSSRNLEESATKDVLAQWVSLALRKALFASNIKNGFRATGIFPLDFHDVDSQLVPSQVYTAPVGEAEPTHGGDDASTRQNTVQGSIEASAQQELAGNIGALRQLHRGASGELHREASKQQHIATSDLAGNDRPQERVAADALQEEQTHCNLDEKEEAEVCVPQAVAADIEADLAEIPDSNAEHFSSTQTRRIPQLQTK